MNQPVNILIVDDEPLARKAIKTSLSDFSNVRISAECANGVEAVEEIINRKPDLIFLDIQMPEMDGFDVIQTVGIDHMPYVIFVTAYDQYAIKAFEKHAFDYLLKPYTPERFHDAVSRVLDFIVQKNDRNSAQRLIHLMQEMQPNPRYVSRLAIRSTARVYFLNVAEIDWIESAGNYIDIHSGNDTHLLRETMSNIETKLDPEKFLRIHRSAIVNIDRIQEIQPDGYDFIVVLKTGKILGMSRKYREKMNDIIKSFF